MDSKLRYRKAKFGELTHHAEPEQNHKRYVKWLKAEKEIRLAGGDQINFFDWFRAESG